MAGIDASRSSDSSDCSVDACTTTTAQLLAPATLAAVAKHLAPIDLLRFSLSSRAAAAALASVPRLWSGAAAAGAAWREDVAEKHKHSSWQEENEACRALLAAAANLAAAVSPHALHPQRHAPPTAISASARRYARADPSTLDPPLSLAATQQWLLSLGGPGLRASLCSASPRTRAPCAAAVCVDTAGAGRPAAAELYLSVARAPPLPMWACLTRAPPDPGAECDGSDDNAAGAPFELFLAEGVEWSSVHAAIQAAIARNAARARAARCAAVLHPTTAGFSLLAAERALTRLHHLGFPVIDLRRLVGTDAAAGPSPSTGQPREEAVRAAALGGAWAGAGAGLEAASQALARAVAALPTAAPDVRALVLPVLSPSHGRVGRAQPGRGSAHAFAAPRLLTLNAPVLGPLRAVMPELRNLELVLIVCGSSSSSSSSGSAQVANGIVRSMVASCLDRHLPNE